MNNFKILMATMGLGLGGAETHIVELSKELARSGNSVSVISSGGVYVDELAAAGIRHFNAPMSQRSLTSIIKAFFIMNKTIKSLRPDVVHAHARIPAFLCSVLCRIHHVPFVTTAHFNFKTAGGLAQLTRWGMRSIAVSEDLKSYLVENYNIKPEHISVTINGISTEKFSPENTDGGLREELGIPLGKRVVLNVSRMDYNACEAAFRLLDAAQNLYSQMPDTHIVIVGSGNALADIKEKADKINNSLGERYITIAGGRTDINRFCAMCDLFVGVSRAALEAMACGKPTILAGNQGFLGLYLTEKLPECIATNFTCRDIPYPNDAVLTQEILAALSMDAQQLSDYANMSRSLIKENYSVGRMAADAHRIYCEVQYSGLKKFDFLLCGYYGYNNSGDDAMQNAAIKNLLARDPHCRICVLTKNPLVPEDGVCASISRFSLLGVIKAIRYSRVMLFGGGNLIQDATSTKSLLYYLWLLNVAQTFKIKTMLYANGIGPIDKWIGQKLSGKVLNKTDVITLREENSLKLLQKIGVCSPYIEITADEVLTLFDEPRITKESGYIAVALRDWKSLDPKFNKKLSKALDSISKTFNKTIMFVPLQHPIDEERCRQVAALLSVRSDTADPHSTYKDNMRLIAGADLVIGMRLHSLVFAAGAGTPSLGIVYDPKIEGFLDYLGIHDYFRCEKIDANDIIAAATSALSLDENQRLMLSERAKQLSALAQRNSELAIKLLEGMI